ncbi:MAG: 30S ribosomal protein S1 [Clostridia bacterium]|nr:30S ribosomal protein S1 [Clostridia bacterium]
MNLFLPEGQLLHMPRNKYILSRPSAIAQAAAEGTILEATATVCNQNHDLLCDLGSMRGVIPRDAGAIGIAEGQVRDIALISRVGKPVSFVVTEIRSDAEGRPLAILSRERAQRLCLEHYINKLQPGQIIDAKITHFENFGAFCDIGCGVIALLPINAISVSRISHPSDRFRCGENIKAVVRTRDSAGRITLSCKELLGTWQENAGRFTQGETVSGIVRSVEDYGVFIELTPNLAGLAEPLADVEIGQHTSVYIKSLLPEKMKVKLIIIDLLKDPPAPVPVKYYLDTGRLERWVYSPKECPKIIETVF